MKKVIVIGSGFSGISAACHLAKKGYDVTILEKNEGPGGRASVFEAEGFTFDMGPSWYWMPEIFDNFFEAFGKKTSDYYNLVRLDPSYRIYFNENKNVDVPAKLEDLYALFEKLEPGSSVPLKKFLKEAEYKYNVGIHEFVHKPGRSIMEFMDWRVFKSIFGLQMLTSMAKHVDNYFKHPHLRELLKFPVLFLGATPENTPAMYSLMNYADLVLGTWYPMGGMHEIIKGMVSVAEELGVKFEYNNTVTEIVISNKKSKKVITSKGEYETDILVGGADYNHIEQALLPKEYRKYSPKYWDSRVMAPSSLLYYVGINKRVKNLKHHNLFFDADFKQHAIEVYNEPSWPSNPLFYVCCPSKTDDSVAPEGCENLFFLMPTAPDLDDKESTREKYFDIMVKRLEEQTGESIRDHIVYKKSFAHSDFKSRYNAFKGNAYGLANTLKQTAILKPSLKSKKVKNLYYTGQLTVPGPGVPPSIISGEVVAKEIFKDQKL
ncbi:MAG: phytoene desaturase family protein [Chitinophagales bacterium]